MKIPTKRWSSAQVRALAKGMRRGDAGYLWYYVGDSIREALIDAGVLKAILLRDDEGSPYTVASIQRLRSDLVIALRKLDMFTDAGRENKLDTALAPVSTAERDATEDGCCGGCYFCLGGGLGPCR